MYARVMETNAQSQVDNVEEGSSKWLKQQRQILHELEMEEAAQEAELQRKITLARMRERRRQIRRRQSESESSV